MALFTFVLDYRGGTYVSQVQAGDPKAALREWIDVVELDAIHGLTSKSRDVFRAAFADERIVPLDGVTNVWCVGDLVRGKGALVNIIETRPTTRTEKR
ncbi:Hypothetical protein A7982_09725 [Minicystis rosea]|nr:Hypothetical protein A7982_09725 [Minicystis rosea]